MRCKIVRFQKLMWCNMMRSTKSQKISVLHYSIDFVFERLIPTGVLNCFYSPEERMLGFLVENLGPLLPL